MTDRQEWFESKKQDLDIYESILMNEAGCTEGILRGNVFFCNRLCQDHFLETCTSENPISDDHVENLRNNFVVLTALISRICIENGMNSQESLRICTLYIRSLDHLNDPDGINERFNAMLLDFCKRMRELNYEINRSPAVRNTIRYLSDHLNERPDLNTLADQAGITPGYLSRRFHEETGQGITEWTHKLLTETAGLLLRYTDDSITAIARETGCSSTSGFIQIFSSQTNRTPNRYRQEFRMNFSRQITSVTDDYKAGHHNFNLTLTGYYLPHFPTLKDDRSRHLADQEYACYEAVLEGDSEAFMKTDPDLLTLLDQRTGVLSNDPLTDEKYHFMIITAVIMRLCIEYRLAPSMAYHLSDYYVTRMKNTGEPGYLHQLMSDQLKAFAAEMKNLHSRRKISEPVRECIEYIYSHTSEKIRTEDLARVCGKSVSWIAHTFPKETGISVKDYVQREKIASAKNMLHYTDLSFSEIASQLSFSSQSHFTLVFHNETGTTPGEWRKKVRATENG